MQILKNKFSSLPNFTNGMKNSMFKIQKRFQYNKKMDLQWKEIHKEKKAIQDYIRMNDMTDFTLSALMLQSDLFHEQLFESLSIILITI
jgi:hypothetical protein